MSKEKEIKTEAVAEVTTPVVRRKRIPVSGPRDILTISKKDPNYSYRWVRDVPGRIQRFLDGGWEYHTDPGSQVGQRTVDTASRLGSALVYNSGGITQVAMRIPKEWYNEDQKAKQDEIDALEDSMIAQGGNLKGMDSQSRPDSAFLGISHGVKRR